MTASSPAKLFFNRLFLFGLLLMAGALPYSKFLVSLSEIFMLIAVIGSGDLKLRLQKFWENKTAVVLGSVYLMHIIGLIWTSDFHYAAEDLRKKIPLLLLPLLFAGSPVLSNKEFKAILAVFALSVLIGAMISTLYLFGAGHVQITHPHQASRFISHIRFGHMVCLTIFILCWFALNELALPWRYYLLVIAFILLLFLARLESAMAVLTTVIGGLFIAYRQLEASNFHLIKKTFLLIPAILLSLLIYKFYRAADEFVPAVKIQDIQLDSSTTSGNRYVHLTENLQIENKNYVWLFVCESELEAEWNKRSHTNYLGKDPSGNEIKYTLIRYLTSKGLRKDADGIKQLTSEDITAIENGITNVNYLHPGFDSRLQEIAWEFHIYAIGGEVAGHSVIQRFEFWKAGHAIFKDHPAIGVGTGDVPNAYAEKYIEQNSQLPENYRLRAHNQYLTMAVTFGLPGLSLFILSLLYPISRSVVRKTFFYPLFMIIILFSFMTEDTLESQMGVTFYAFFNSLFLFLEKK